MIVQATLWRVITQVLPLVINLALTPFVILTLGARGYGVWLVSSALTQFVAQVDGGVGRVAQRFLTLRVGTSSTADTTPYVMTLSLLALAAGGLVLLPVFALSPILVDFFHVPDEMRDDAIFLVRIMLVGVLVTFVRNVWASLMQAHRRWTVTAIATIAGYLTYAGLTWFTLSEGYGLRGVGLALLAQHVVITLIVLPFGLRLLRGPLGLVSGEDLKPMLGMAWRLQGSGALTMLMSQAPLLIVGRMLPLQMPFFGPGFTFAQQLRLLPMNAVPPVANEVGHTLSSGGREEAARQISAWHGHWKSMMLAWCGVGLPVAAVGVNIWLPLDGPTPGLIAGIMLLYGCLVLLQQLPLQWMVLLGRTDLELESIIVGVVAGLGLAFLGSLLGSWGVAAGLVLGQGAGLLVTLARASSLGMHSGRLTGVASPGLLLLAVLMSTGLASLIHRLSGSGYWPPAGIGLVLAGLCAAPILVLYLWRSGDLAFIRRLARS